VIWVDRPQGGVEKNVTKSKGDLSVNKALALQLIGQHCANAPIGDEYEMGLPQFQLVLKTTWQALNDDQYIRVSTWHFKLTAKGWVKALEATGRLCDDKMKEDLGNLSGRLKDCLHGRGNGPALVGTDEIVNKTGLPHYWVVNAIHSRLIERCLRRVGAFWAEDDHVESVIEVPVRFGHPL
jgi:hypothetical protein